MFGKYSEHRIFYVKLNTLLDYYLFGQVNLIRLNFIGNLGLLGIAVILFKTLKPVDNRWLFFLPVLFLLFQLQYIGIIFSPMSALQNINTVLFAFASLYFLNKKETRYFIWALVFAVVGCFSSGNGMFIFMAGLLVLFTGNYSYIFKSIWILVMIISIAWYFQDFGPVANSVITDGYSHRSFTQALKQTIFRKPHIAMSSMFAFIGGSLSGAGQKVGLLVSLVAGFSIIVYSMYLLYNGYYKRNPLLFGFLLFLIASALALAIVRVDRPITHMIIPRYHFFSLLFIIVVYLTFLEEFDLLQKKKVAFIVLGLSKAFYRLVFGPSIKAFDAKRVALVEGAKSYHRIQNRNRINWQLDSA